ncbi:MAG TPA: DUF1491 family protein [Sphingomicrobium sp.]|nr:DUF1491 family protein [Sphingomicrobium sp.]
MDGRLPSHLEVAAIMRQVEAKGGFATVLRKGDPDRGALTLILQKRGEFRGILERELGPDFQYEWMLKSGGSDSLNDLIAKKLQFDPDFWLIELDIADPERFIAETTRQG